MNNWQELAKVLVEKHIAPQGISDPIILEAMKRVPRHLFVPEEFQAYGYMDSPLSIGEKQTISQPFMVARMTELLTLDEGDKVLEIGTGSGYQAALLAEMKIKVTTVERIEELASRAREVFQRLSYHTIHSVIGDGREGYLPDAPYKGILVTAGTCEVRDTWLSQLVEGGKIVVPLLVQEGIYRLLVRQKVFDSELGYMDTWYDTCRFVPLLAGVKKKPQ